MNIFRYLLCLIFSDRSIYMQRRTGSFTGSFSKNTMYLFLNNIKTNWKRFIVLPASRIICNFMKPLTDDSMKDVFIVDDSLFDRSRSKKTGLLARIFDHCSMKYKIGRMFYIGIFLRRIWYMSHRRKMKSMRKQKVVNNTSVYISNKSIDTYGFHLYDDWLRANRQGKRIGEFFADNLYQKIAIYGLGYIGKQLIEELENTEVDVAYAIDQNAGNIKYDKVKVISPAEFVKSHSQIDAIAVTPIHVLDEIAANLCRSEKDADVISIRTIIDYMKYYK